jgi:small subunit ribosomal protein S17
MAEKNEEQEEQREPEEQAPEADAAPGAEAEAPEAEAPETEAPEAEAADEPEGDAAEEDSAEGAAEPAAEPEAEAETAVAAEAPAEAPPEPMHPKEIRRAVRRTHSGETRSQRGPEERQTERGERRRARAQARRAWRSKVRIKRAQHRSEAPPPQEAKPGGTGKPKTRQGVVVSDRADKTITVRIDITRRHPRYEKTIRSSSTLHAHDERNEAHTGDTVRVVESRPMSRTKRWRLVEVLERAR